MYWCNLVGVSGRQIRLTVISEKGIRRGVTPSEVIVFSTYKKSWRSEFCVDSYRKPTQVGEESILRRVRELQLRNSAKYYCNFGRR